jgi:hypothetical protein
MNSNKCYKEPMGGKRGFDGDDETQKFGQGQIGQFQSSPVPNAHPSPLRLGLLLRYCLPNRARTLDFGLPTVTRKSLLFKVPETSSNQINREGGH